MKYLIINPLLLGVFVFFPYVETQVFAGDMIIPVADVLAMFLASIFLLLLLTNISAGLKLPVINRSAFLTYGIFLIVCICSLKYAYFFRESLKFFFRKPLFYYAVYFVGVGSVVIWVGKKHLPTLYNFLCFSLFVSSAISIATSLYRISSGDVFGITSIESLMVNHKVLAVSIAGFLPALTAMYFNKRGLARKVYLFTIILCILAVVLSFSKAAWLALAVEAILMVNFKLRHARYLRVCVNTIAVAVLAVASYYLYNKLSAYGEVKQAELYRMFLAAYAVSLFYGNPLLGSGIGSFFYEIQNKKHLLESLGLYGLSELDAHGMVFKLISETGLLGLIAYTLFFISIFRSLYRRYRLSKDGHWQGLLYGGMVTVAMVYFLNSFFGTDTYSPRLWLPLSFVASHIYLAPDGAANEI
ncbi:MAG: O-antigen ligase family protein [Nitrospirota bacterium]